jgi:hypothetical protein
MLQSKYIFLTHTPHKLMKHWTDRLFLKFHDPLKKCSQIRSNYLVQTGVFNISSKKNEQEESRGPRRGYFHFSESCTIFYGSDAFEAVSTRHSSESSLEAVLGSKER